MKRSSKARRAALIQLAKLDGELPPNALGHRYPMSTQHYLRPPEDVVAHLRKIVSEAVPIQPANPKRRR